MNPFKDRFNALESCIPAHLRFSLMVKGMKLLTEVREM